jgi:tetratricopeptide (TPR) repeat protein
MFAGALGIFESLVDGLHPDIGIALSNLASLYRKLGYLEIAEALYVRANDNFVAILGTAHPHSGMNFAALAGVYREQERFDEAETLFKYAVTVLEETLGDGHARVRGVMKNLAELYSRMGRPKDAFRLEARAFEAGHHHGMPQ